MLLVPGTAKRGAAKEVEALVHEVGQRKGLNQHEFLTFMRKYRDFEAESHLDLYPPGTTSL